MGTKNNTSMTLEEDKMNVLLAEDESLNMEPTVIIKNSIANNSSQVENDHEKSKLTQFNHLSKQLMKIGSAKNNRYRQYEYSIDSKFSKSKMTVQSRSKISKPSKKSKSKSNTKSKLDPELPKPNLLKPAKTEIFKNFKPRKIEDHEHVENLLNIDRENGLEIKIESVEQMQDEIKWSMRAILIDWMSEVAYDFDLTRETFHYAVKYLDMCMASR
jgi:hypothetical protein